MRKPFPRRWTTAAVIVLAPACLIIANLRSPQNVSARAGASRASLAVQEAARITRHAALKADLTSTHSPQFRQALRNLESLDEHGALELWESALRNPEVQLQREAWEGYQRARIELSRKEYVPQIVQVTASADEVLAVARETGLEVNIWSAKDGETVVAAPPYLIERLDQAAFSTQRLYDSITDWQQARSSGDSLAQSITPDYQSASELATLQARVAVIDLDRKTNPAPGYSDWLGDRENILMRTEDRIAYLDLFKSDGSQASIDSHIDEQYNKRGYHVAGFYTLDEFEQLAPRLFLGKTFDAGRGRARGRDSIAPALLEGNFHSYQETLAEFTQLAQQNPNLAKVVNLGPTYEGRQVFALKITRDPSIDDTSKPEILITGCHHAREWISVEPPVYFANQLIAGYATDDKIKHLVDNLQIWIVPIVNPDGLSFSQLQNNDVTDGTRLWRKNRRPITSQECESAFGVDLNRNYDFQWRLRGDDPCPDYADDAGGSDNPNNEIYRGANPGSELEIKAIRSLVDDPQRRFRVELDYHNYSQLILYPWGYQSDSAPDAPTLSKLARTMSEEILKVNNFFYRPQQAIDLYVTTGASVDYAYGTGRVPASFTVEVRPGCCNFIVPESEITQVNQENWAGARPVLDWASGPPILESVKAYQRAADGTTTKLIYSARWQETGTEAGRQFIVDARFPGLEPGRMIVRLQFSKPMDTLLEPRVTLGRSLPPEELRAVAADSSQGWQKSVYSGDTWVGELVIPQDGDQDNPWRLGVGATDSSGFKLDAMPETAASYAIGTNGWANYEDANSAGSEGGSDMLHRLSPTLRGDFLDVFVASPNGGERLPGGEPYVITWRVPREAGFIPVEQQIMLSVDGGVNFTPLAQGISGALEKLSLTLPRTATTAARIRVVAREGVFGNVVFGDNQNNFTIAANVGSGVGIGFASSERVDLNWSEAPSEENPSGASGTSRLAINLNITNDSSVPIANPFIRVDTLTRAHVVLSRDSRSNSGEGARQTIDAGGDDVLAPGETVQARLIVGLIDRKKFQLRVGLYGVPVGGSITPSDGVKVWKGKPKTK